MPSSDLENEVKPPRGKPWGFLAKESKKARPQAGTKVTYAAIRLRRKLLP
jgi:hypothetical protein